MESSREAQALALQELSAKLQQEYDEKLQVEQEKHREEIEKLQVCTVYSANNLGGKKKSRDRISHEALKVKISISK